MMPCAQIKPDN